MSFIAELKRRNVFKVGIAYLVATWLLLQLSDILVPLLGLPESAQKLILLLLVIGFIPALIIAWAFEMTPEGIRKEKDVDRQQSITPQTGRKLNIAITSMLVVALTYFIWEARFATGPVNESPAVTSDPVDQAASKEPAPTAHNDKSVAVLPFVNMSSDPEQEYFSDGLSEELLNRLAQNEQLHVAARTSAFQFKGQNLDIADIGRQLKVANVLEGSVRKSGNRLRITAQLIKVDNGFHLWSQTYEREMNDIFAIQDDISAAIAHALEVELGATATQDTGQPTKNLEAYNLYLQARYLLAERGEKNMRKANDLFEQAVALDPEFSLAWSGMAFNSALMPSYSLDTTLNENYEKTMFSAQKALELDPESAEAYTAIGRAQSNTYEWQAAQDSFEHAYRLEPNSVGVLNFYGDFMSVLGDFEEAIRLKMSAIIHDPLSPVHASDLADNLLASGRYEEALVSARRGVKLAPKSIARRSSLVFVLLQSGALEEAKTLIDETDELMSTNPRKDYFITKWLSVYYYQKNDIDSLRKLVGDTIQASRVDGSAVKLDYYEVAFFVLWLDGVEAALPLLEKSFAAQESLTDYSYFYLPERISDNREWMKFWNQPELKSFLDIRRSKPFENVSLWKERKNQ